ncbi:sialate O-acetylesterase [Pedobacter cryophilus]|uniref:Sialate O-acetylesterase n=1 Tax=Pedobacter cryophilus TaxID=2571271 RepID=A0A4U1BZG5_9SPHI|nr:sialate O-acetylesterase [Pedobacter cryophilus]TKB96896.1 sialate O-acetylesterase [Pedobacter cryophilus]
MIFIKVRVLLILIICSPVILKAQVSVNSIFTNHMVLQQNAKVKIWGKASLNENVEIIPSFLKKSVKTVTDDKGNWIVEINTPAHGGPYKMSVKGKNNQIDIEDIYLGEVWLASGQSNMQFPLDSNSKGYNGVTNFKEEVENANYPFIRQFVVKGAIARTESDTQKGEWLISNQENAKKISALAYFFSLNLQKDLKVPIGIINASWGGTCIEAWMSAKDLDIFENEVLKLQKITDVKVKMTENYPSVLYNGMIHPLKNYTVKGVVWCQGENNINDPRDYAQKMEKLVSGWRTSLNQKKLPFLYVQIAPFNYLQRTKQYFWGTENSLGFLVEQQTKVLAMSHVFMARTGDVGVINNIHYRNKQEVGYRLSLLALKEVYKKDKGIINGPNVSKIEYLANQAFISYSNIGTGLKIKGSLLNGFELSEDGVKFYPATANLEGNKVTVKADYLLKVTAIRYCFKNIHEANLFNSDGLPALPFRTDNVPYEKPNNQMPLLKQ